MEKVILNKLVLFPEDVYDVRQKLKQKLMPFKLNERQMAELEIIVSELASNLVRHHAKKGIIQVSIKKSEGQTAVQIRSDDEGPGIKDLNNLKEGLSSGGGLGIGLQSVKRLSDVFEIESDAIHGTHIKVLKWIKTQIKHHISLHIRTRPKPGETVSGDLVYTNESLDTLTLIVVDALGHGEEAHKAAEKVREIIQKTDSNRLDILFKAVHAGLKGMRGAAMTGIVLNRDDLRFSHLGIGNVQTCIISSEKLLRPICYNGTLGAMLPRLKVEHYHLLPGSKMYIYTDGISSSFERNEEVFSGDIQQSVNTIFENYAKDIDDATVVGISVIGE